MEKQTFVVEEECERCGAPLREGVTAVREAREGDKFGGRQMNSWEIPARLQARAADAHPHDAIVKMGFCDQCDQSY